MTPTGIALIGTKSKYKGVYYGFRNDIKKHFWRMIVGHDGLRCQKDFAFNEDGERQAAMAYDLKRIEFGKEPVNILKKR